MSLGERWSVGAGAALVVAFALACKGGAAGTDAGTGTVASTAASPTPTPSATAALAPVTDQEIVTRLMKALSKAAGCPSRSGTRRAARSIERGTPLAWDLVDEREPLVVPRGRLRQG